MQGPFASPGSTSLPAGILLNPGHSTRPIHDLLLRMLEPSLASLALRASLVEELGRPVKQKQAVLAWLGLEETGTDVSDGLVLHLQSPRHSRKVWLESLLARDGDQPIGFAFETADAGRVIVVHEVFRDLPAPEQEAVRRYARLVAAGESQASILSFLASEASDTLDRLVAARRLVRGLDPSVLFSPDGELRVQLGSISQTTRTIMHEGIRGETLFILPSALFEGKINYLDVEFVVYLNFFMRRKARTRIAGTRRQQRQLEALLERTIFGLFRPDADTPSFLELQADHAVPDPETYDFFRACYETYAVRRDADPAGAVLGVSEYLDFRVLDDAAPNRIAVPASVAPGEPPREYDVEVAAQRDGSFALQVTQPDGARASKCLVVSPPAPESVAVADELVEPLRFGTDRPLFGVTPLGTSHGFDPGGSFTSFVIWIDGQGLLVDPSPDALERLAQLRVAPCDLSYVLLTHVHADHDGGLLQSVLSGRRTTIVSSDVVFRMFLEKARIITGHDLEKEGLVVHVSANPGSPTQLDLAGEPVVIETRWNLHTIPTNGFKITVGGRSFGYSGDTQYDPGLIERLRSRFSLAARLVDDLLHFFWTQDGQPSVDLVYHEAGVPPIHTERRMLEALPEEIRARMCLVHIADRDVPPGASPAKPKLLSTHVLLPATADSRRRILLRTLRLVSYLYDVPSATLERLVALGRERVFAPGDVVVRRGPVDPSDPRHFYVLLDGELTVLNGKRLLTKLGKADTFGEWGISQPRGFRVADVVAVRHSQALELDGEAYRWLVAAHPAIQGRIHRFRILLLALQAARLSAAWMPGDSRAGTSLLTTMSLGELAAIAVFGETQRATHGTRILSEGERADCFHVVLSGHLTVSLGGHLLSDLAEGDVFGEMALLEGGVRTATVEVASAEAELLVLNEHSFRALLAEDPAFSYAIRALALQRGEDNRRLVPEASEGRFAAGRP